MYCTNCGQKVEGGEFCTNCGQRIAPSLNSQAPNTNYAINSTVSKTAIQHKNNKTVFAVLGGAVALVILIFVLTTGKKSENNDAIPYYSDPYNNTQGYIQPPVDYSNGFDYSYDDSYDSYDSYDYSNSSLTCPSCFGSGTCPICNGTGQYSMYGNDYSDCTACYGTGICSICGGDGVC